MALKGKATIQLFDASTGDEVQKIEEENMVTESAFNLANNYNIKGNLPAIDSNEKCTNLKTCLNPLINNVFSSIHLLDGQLIENKNNIIFDFSCDEVGFATSVSSDDIINPNYKGTYNTSESIDTSDGRKMVFDFPTNCANGTIRSVALSSGTAGVYGFVGKGNLATYLSVKNINAKKNGVTSFVTNSVSLAAGNSNGVGSEIAVLVSNEFIYLFIYVSSNSFKIKKLKFSDLSMGLFSINNELKTESETTYGTTKTLAKYVSTGGKYVYSGYILSDNSVDYIKIDIETGNITELNLTIQDYSPLSKNRAIGIIEDENNYYLLNPAYNGDSDADYWSWVLGVYKINKLDVSDYSYLDFKNISGSTLATYKARVELTKIGTNVIAKNTLEGNNSDKTSFVLSKDIVNKFLLNDKSIPIENLQNSHPFTYFRDDVYTLCGRTNILYYKIYSPFLSTINNLSTPVVKNETQTMKVTYEITEV